MASDGDKNKTNAPAGSNGKDGKGTGLSDFLAEHIRDQLIKFQGVGRDKVRDQLLDCFSPTRSQIFDLMKQANARMDEVHDELKRARKAGRLYPWIVPSLAAISFEGVFESALAVWLLAGEPAKKDELNPSVEEFIRFETRLFSTMVGA